MLMTRKEVLVQLDDELAAHLDALAEREGTSRSELLRRGAIAVLDAMAERDDDGALIEAYRRIPQDPAVVRSARRLAARTAPEW
jgi:metal-responsive CopG/Arc/MetJ family transcriptional regulator